MSVSPSDFLTSADSLAASADKNEMTLRNVLSRAYYAAFHRAQEFAPSQQAHNDGIGMHRSYIEQLMQNKSGSIERKLAEKLKSMYSRRIKADYQLDKNIAHDDVPVQLYSAKALFKLLENPIQTNQKDTVIAFPAKK